MDEPKVSVCMITYNHEPFIEQAVRSVLGQKVDFNYEIVIGEDCSTDRTLSILERLKEEYPQVIQLLPAESNLGMWGNFFRTIQACNGEYIALLEGDDYWVVPHKLQRQVDFLDANLDCVLCHTNVLVEDIQDKTPPWFFCREDQKTISTLDDLLCNCYISTCSVMIRRKLVNTPSWLMQSFVVDYPLYILLAKWGTIGYLPEVTTHYRIHCDGVWSSMDTLKKIDGMISMYSLICNELSKDHDQYLNLGLYNYLLLFSRDLFNHSQFFKEIIQVETLIQKKIETLPKRFSFIIHKQGKLLGLLWIERGFLAHRQGNRQLASKCFRQAVRHDFSWLSNRGVLSILLRYGLHICGM